MTKANWLVAANSIVSKQIDLGIEVRYSDVILPLSDPVRDAHIQSGRDWLTVAKVTQAASDMGLVEEAVRRVKDGVLLAGSDTRHVSRLLDLLMIRGVNAGDFHARGDPNCDVVVVTKRQCRGYNEASRLGALVTGVYAGNAADRHQLIGRLKRIGQKRATIDVVPIFIDDTISKR